MSLSRVPAIFSHFLVSIFGCRGKMKRFKKIMKKIENFWSKIDFQKKIPKFSDFSKISKISPKIFRFSKNYNRDSNTNRKIFGENFEIFEKSENFRIFFENRFSTKNFQYFFMIFFFNRYRFFWRIQT